MNLMISDNCPWCHLPSNFRERICRRCGHCARLPQPLCDCAACLSGRPTYKMFHFDAPPDLLETMDALVAQGFARRANVPAAIPAVFFR